MSYIIVIFGIAFFFYWTKGDVLSSHYKFELEEMDCHSTEEIITKTRQLRFFWPYIFFLLKKDRVFLKKFYSLQFNQKLRKRFEFIERVDSRNVINFRIQGAGVVSMDAEEYFRNNCLKKHARRGYDRIKRRVSAKIV